MESVPWLTLLERLGIPLALVIGGVIAIAKLGQREVWVFGRELRKSEEREVKCQADYEKRLTDAQRREDEWKQAALNGGYLARQAVELARRQSPSGRS